MATPLTFDGHEVAFTLLSVEVRYYSLCIIATLLSGYAVWMWQSRNRGVPARIASSWLNWGALGVLIGARLGHCLFYDPLYYLASPVEILKLWKGGAASHGAAVGLVVASALWARRHGFRFVEVFDRLALVFPTATFMRLGNFMNSETMGRASDLPWAVRFSAYGDHGAQPRHPAQIYEFLFGALVFVLLLGIERRARQGRPVKVGVLGALFLVVYFTGRFGLEYFKEPEGSFGGPWLSTAQVLCIPFILVGCVRLWKAVGGRYDVER